MAEEENSAGSQELKPNKKKLIIIGLVAVLVLALLGAAAVFFLGSESNAEAVEVVEPRSEHLTYHDLNPPFVMSYLTRTGQRYAQIGITVSSYVPRVLETLEQHDPKVRSEILRIIGEQDFTGLRSDAGKEKLLQELESRLAAIVREEAQLEGIEAVLFNNFVIQ